MWSALQDLLPGFSLRGSNWCRLSNTLSGAALEATCPGQPYSLDRSVGGGVEFVRVQFRLRGASQAQKQLVTEVQEIYRSQGVDIHSKHIEVIVRQMMRRVTVLEPGDTSFMPGELVDSVTFREENRRIAAQGGQFAKGRQMLMGITKASLATDSWLSAASFQETTKVLTDAAMNAKSDPLLGLKENVILGKLIPAGTGLPRYNDVSVEPTAEAMAEMNYSPLDFAQPDDHAGLEDFVHSLEKIDFGLGFSNN